MSPARTLLRVAWQSLLSRRLAAAFVVLAVAVSTVLYLSVERMREGARQGFASTVSGTDLIVGARAGSVQLMLYSVFRIGSATNNITWESARDVAALPGVAWTVPLSLGDSHRSYRVIGTTADYFDRYRYGRDRALTFDRRTPGSTTCSTWCWARRWRAPSATIWATVSSSRTGWDRPGWCGTTTCPSRCRACSRAPARRWTARSISASTRSPPSMSTGSPARASRRTTPADVLRERAAAGDLEPDAITAMLVGLDSRLAVFRTARAINDYPEEPLLAVLPGVALQELWSVLGVAERALAAVSAMVVLTAVVGLVATILATLEQRRREMAVLRSLGARPRVIGALLMLESGLLALAGVTLGALVVLAVEPVVAGRLAARFGLDLVGGLSARDALVLAAIVAGALLAALVPAWRASRMSAGEGLGGG